MKILNIIETSWYKARLLIVSLFRCFLFQHIDLERIVFTGGYSLRVSANFYVTFNTTKSTSHRFNAAKLSPCIKTSKPVLLQITFLTLFLREIFWINLQNKWAVIEWISSRKELHRAKLKLVKIPLSVSGRPQPWQGLIQFLQCSIAAAVTQAGWPGLS